MNYQEWELSVPPDIKGDGLWKMEAYRLALFLSDLAWHDATKLLLTMIPDQRYVTLKEDSPTYIVATPDLLKDAPLPE